MGTPIVKLDGLYLLWSTVSDSPASFGMTLDQLRAYFREEHGRHGVEDLERRLVRVEEKGTSSFDDDDADDTIWLNRAGPRSTSLHREEIIEFFVRRKQAPTDEALEKLRDGLPRCGPSCPSIRDANGCSSWCRSCWGTDFVRQPPTRGSAS